MKQKIKSIFTREFVLRLFQLLLIVAVFKLAIMPGFNARNSALNAIAVVATLVVLVFAGYVLDEILDKTIDRFSENDQSK